MNLTSFARSARSILPLLTLAVAAAIAGCQPAPVAVVDAGSDDAPLPGDGSLDSAPRCTTATDCDDGLYCNGDEACTAGRCVGGARSCDDGVACTVDTCSEERVRCENRAPDADADGYGDAACVDGAGAALGNDCDDGDDTRFPGNPEVCDDVGHDEDCDGTTLGGLDADGDGHESDVCCNPVTGGGRTCGDDCDDARRQINPTGTEVCDGLDDDCDGMIDDGVTVTVYEDGDRDGHGDPARSRTACAGIAGLVSVGDDCDDTRVDRHPAQLEFCDGVDNDCDGTIDDNTGPVRWYTDSDGDGFGSASSGAVDSCAPIPTASLLGTDCDDSRAAINPAAAELCDGRDNDCSGVPDYAISPGDFEDDDADGYVDIGCGAPLGVDCEDDNPAAGPGEPEACDGRDNDCDMSVDEDVATYAWFRDADDDGYGTDATTLVVSCLTIPGHVRRGGDCDDASATRNPAAAETCTGRDEDCDGTVDEAPASDECIDALFSDLACVVGVCRSVGCLADHADCDGTSTNGCETILAADPLHCGTCSNRCGASEVCSAGSCATSCAAGLVDCSGRCVDAATDPLYCGASGDCAGPNRGVVCPSGSTCVAAACTTSCPPGQIVCAGRCVDPLTDRAYCGASASCTGANAGSVCAGGQVCAAGSCATSCPAGQVDCAGRCIDPMTDRGYCGASGTCTGGSVGAMCGAGQVCAAGTCATSCPAGQIVCAGTCVDPLSDRTHCGASSTCTGAAAGAVCGAGQVCAAGACATSCPASQVDCAGRCIDPLSDRSYCGATGPCTGPSAGSVCASGQVCAAGLCATSCPPSQIDCTGRCIDPLTDNAYCGASGSCSGTSDGTVCAAGQVCAAGACATSCPASEVECVGRCIDPLTDRSYCGASGTCSGASAGTVCASGEVCTTGVCATSCPVSQVECAGRCIDPLTDRAYCGATGTCSGASAGDVCGAGQVCAAGVCATSCPPGQIDCAGRCVDPFTDRAYCGASGACSGASAGIACGSGQVCMGGSCITSCPAGQLECAGRCVDPFTDRAYCGASGTCTGANAGSVCGTGTVCASGVCATSCPPTQIVCGGVCVDPFTDRTYCGASGSCSLASDGTVCGAGQVCSAGTCIVSCASPLINCGGACVDPRNDPMACGMACTVCASPPNTTPLCLMSSCATICRPGFLECNAISADGCETDPSTDELHCGNCSTTCRVEPNAASTCTAGSCGPLVCNGGFSDCDGNLGSGANGCETVGTGCPRVAWSYTWGDANDDWLVGSGRDFEVATDNAGNVYAVGTYGSDISVAGMPYTAARFGGILVALSPTGTLRWVANIAATGSGDFLPHRILFDPGSNALYLAGTGWGGNGTIGGTIVGPQNGNCTAWLARLSPVNGAVTWGRTYPNAGCSSARALAVSSTGSLVTGGYFQGDHVMDGFMVSAMGATLTDAWVAHVDRSTGNTTGLFRIGAFGSEEQVYAIAGLPGGDLAVAGLYTSAPADIGGTMLPWGGNGQFDGFYARFNAGGARLYAFGINGPNREELADVVASPSGDFYVAGMYDSSTSIAGTPLSGSSFGTMLARIDGPSGFVEWACGGSGGGNAQYGMRRIAVDATDDVRVAWLTSSSATGTFCGMAVPNTGANARVARVRGATGVATRIESFFNPSGILADNAIALLPDGRAVTGGDYQGAFTLDGASFPSYGDPGFWHNQYVMLLAPGI